MLRLNPVPIQRFRIPTLSTIRVLEPLNCRSANWNLSIAGSAIVERNGRAKVENAVGLTGNDQCDTSSKSKYAPSLSIP